MSILQVINPWKWLRWFQMEFIYFAASGKEIILTWYHENPCADKGRWTDVEMKFTFGIWLTNHSWRKGSLWKMAQTPSNGNDTANVRNVLIKWNRNSRQNERDLILILRITRAGSFVINWKRMHRNPNEKVFIFQGSTLFYSVHCFKWKKEKKVWWEQKVSFHNFFLPCRIKWTIRTNERTKNDSAWILWGLYFVILMMVSIFSGQSSASKSILIK